MVLVFHTIKSSTYSNHVKSMFSGLEFFKGSIYMRQLIICPTAMVDYSLFNGKPLSMLTPSDVPNKQKPVKNTDYLVHYTGQKSGRWEGA